METEQHKKHRLELHRIRNQRYRNSSKGKETRKKYKNEVWDKWLLDHPDKVELWVQHSISIRQQERIQAKQLIGDKCIVCGTTINVHFHEKYGNHHENFQPKYYIDHYQDFIPLCYLHHLTIHVIDRTPQVLNYLIKPLNQYL